MVSYSVLATVAILIDLERSSSKLLRTYPVRVPECQILASYFNI